ncbi:STM4504/CBY_0614 family protein [Dinghuibacter silviterrae]|uniref:Abortive infection Abi-like protein n=1 Tax=Dinghuibacter silviterrae TaxID=1539049 RepID=A0A4R8DJE2_9BACT|nr:hypothetical protein [Dinghuibacter silviterrae]TDW97120.1 hypothetical protein EDB95_4961 [Dinghuibacter silviterrae]
MILDLYSTRNAPPCKELIYDSFPIALRRQLMDIANNFFGFNNIVGDPYKSAWRMINKLLRESHGRETLHYPASALVHVTRYVFDDDVKQYFYKLEDIQKMLDVLEVVFLVINSTAKIRESKYLPVEGYKVESVVQDFNQRLSQHCSGYRLEEGMMVRMDNDLLHQEVTREVLILLTNPDYSNIDAEYRQALKHFRNGDYKDSVVNAGKAFESTMKVICDQKGYAYASNATAAPLMSILYQEKFIPEYLQNGLGGLRAMLEGGVSVIRNKTSAHGAGSQDIQVDENLANYALYNAGATIRFLLRLLENK